MCGDSEVKCEVSVIELEDGYQVRITGGDIKDAINPEDLKKCIESCCSGSDTCCSGEAPFKGGCCG